MKVAYLDCFSGISGDMFVGALLDAGLAFEDLKKALESLPLQGYTIEAKRGKKNELMSTHFVVNVDKKGHDLRGLNDIKRIINGSGLSAGAKKRSISIFESIARVEGKIHDRGPDEVHFHEVGAVDSIIDIVGAVFGIESLGIDSITCSGLPLGSGFTESGHGRIPVPAPATAALLKGIPVYDSGLRYELVTPTGAALVKEFAGSFENMPPMTIDSVGYGMGCRDLPDRPNLLRIIIGHDRPEARVETIVILEANVDDSNPEWLGFMMEKLFENNALDVAFYPIQMKKNRPGIQIQVIGKPRHKDMLMDILFRESTTLGVRFRYSQRKILERSRVTVETPWGQTGAKKVVRPDGSFFLQPEYDSCRKIAEENGVSIREVYQRIMTDRGNHTEKAE